MTTPTAGLVRRTLALGLDALIPAALVSLLLLVGILDARPLRPPPDWFWTEWWFKFWLDDPAVFVTPLVLFGGLWLVWIMAWEALTDGGSPGDRAAGIRVVDEQLRRPSIPRQILRTAGVFGNVATLGLGWLWVAVSPTRRGVHDMVSGTWVIVSR